MMIGMKFNSGQIAFFGSLPGEGIGRSDFARLLHRCVRDASQDAATIREELNGQRILAMANTNWSEWAIVGAWALVTVGALYAFT